MTKVTGMRPYPINLASDHLDRYGSVEIYHVVKPDTTRVQHSSDDLVVPAGLNVKTQAQILHFHSAHLRLADGSAVLETSELPEGVHPANAAEESLLRQLDQPVRPDFFKQDLKTARLVSGRFETVARWERCGSIASHTGAVQSVLEKAKAPLACLRVVGGFDKGADLEPVYRAAVGEISCVIAFSEDGPRRAEALGLPFVVPFAGQDAETTMIEAVTAESLDGGSTVLLATIGTRFDLCRDYAERGAALSAVAEAWINSQDAHQTSEVSR